MVEVTIGKSGRIKNLSSLLASMTANEIQNSVTVFNQLHGNIDSYNPSTHYNLVVDGNDYPPKAIFGIAASKILGFTVKSQHFSAGEETPYFNILRKLGFSITLKNERPGPKQGLELYKTYNREQASKIFDPYEPFTTGAGKWGNTGIVTDVPCIDDFVFFVTLGKHDGNTYEDSVTDDGVLIWKSQNQHTPESKVILRLLKHDAQSNNIYLFLRSSESDDYTYMGTIAFRDWDPTTSNPVHFTWDIISWPIESRIINKINLPLLPALSPTYSKVKQIDPKSIHLVEENPQPRKTNKKGKSNSTKIPDWAEREQRNRRIGNAGELIVIEYEIEQLKKVGRHDLAKNIEHIAQENPSAGYDILSFDPVDGSEKYIEVKTTSGGNNTPFYISDNEVKVSIEKGSSYWIYRVFEYRPNKRTAKFYRQQGSVADTFTLEPISFRASTRD